MHNEFTQAKTLINKSRKILLTTHERTDGDDLGSVLALWHELMRQGKEADIVIRGGVPHNLTFLPGHETVREELPHQNYDLLISSGCSVKKRIGHDAIMGLNIPVLNIDHHPDNQLFGHVNMVNADKSAVAELIYDFFRFCGYQLNHKTALSLLTGIFTDTGSFMHSNTKASTLNAAADLMRRGAHLSKVAKHTYKGKNMDILRAWSKAFANTYINPGQGVIYSIITEEDLHEINVPQSAFEGFVETLNKAPEARFALFLKQDGDIIKGSLRSDPHKNVDVGQLARQLGGGGHMWASGFSLPGKLVKDSEGKWQVVETRNT